MADQDGMAAAALQVDRHVVDAKPRRAPEISQQRLATGARPGTKPPMAASQYARMRQRKPATPATLIVAAGYAGTVARQEPRPHHTGAGPPSQASGAFA
jgi:hypothetical protein